MSLLLQKKTLQKLKDYESNSAWYRRNYKYLRDNFSGKYVFIKGGEVADSDKDYRKLLLRVRKKHRQTRSHVIKLVTNRDVYPVV